MTRPQIPQDSPSDESLTAKQLAAVGLLAAGKAYTDVAAELGVDRKTVWSWRRDPAFAAALSAELEDLREAIQTRVLALADKALNALEQTLDSGDSDSARVAAARLVLDRLLPTHSPDEQRSQGARIITIRDSDLKRLGDMQREADEVRRQSNSAMTRSEAR
jgi:hypothetical protein